MNKDLKDLYEYCETYVHEKKNLLITGFAAAAVLAYIASPRVNKTYDPGEILLEIKAGTITQVQDLEKGVLGVPSLDKLGKKNGVTWAEKVFDTVHEGNASRVYQIEMPHDADIEDIVNEYKNNPNVKYAEPDFVIKIDENKSWLKKAYDWILNKDDGITPNDPKFNDQWGLKRINAPHAWKTQKGSKNVIIAIIDSGVDYNHEDLADKILKDKDGNIVGWNFVKGNNDPMDGNGHGTHCAGIAAASTNNEKGGSGVAWNSKIMPLKGLGDNGSGFSEDLADCIVWAADHGANVLSNSWGGMYPTNTIHEAIKYAHDKGVIVVAAAGNDNTSRTHYPSGYKEVISVAATDEDDEKASFSNFGKTVDISAPGVEILSTFPDDEYIELNGTSMATPFVSGVAAMIISENPNLNVGSVENIIKNSGDKIKDSKMPPRINLEKAIENARNAK